MRQVNWTIPTDPTGTPIPIELPTTRAAVTGEPSTTVKTSYFHGIVPGNAHYLYHTQFLLSNSKHLKAAP